MNERSLLPHAAASPILPKTLLVSFASSLALIFAAACNDAPSSNSPDAAGSTSAAVTVSAAPSASAAPSGSASDAPLAPASATPLASAVPSASAASSSASHPKDAGAPAAKVNLSADAGAVAAEPVDAGPPPKLDAPAAGSADEVAAKVDDIFADKKTFKASFKQEYIVKVSNTTKKSTGTVIVSKPNRISFRYDSPNQNRIVSDGTLLKVYVAEDTQMFTQPVGQTEYPGALAFIMGRGLRPSFTFTFNDKAKFEGGPVLVGKPRVPTPSYESVLFYIDKALLEKKDPGVIRRVLILDVQSNKNRFDFDNASQPASVDASEFAFTPPAGTTITQP